MQATHVLACLGLLVLAHDAVAGPKDQAKKHLAAATRAHGDGKYDVALTELQAAYKLDPQPELLYAIGQVYAKLGECDEAKAHYDRFLAKNTDPAAGPAVQDAIAACQPKAAAIKAKPERAKEPKRPPPRPRAVAKAPRAQPRSEPVMRSERRTPSPWYKDVLGDVLVVGGVAATIGGVIEYRGAVSDLDAAEDSADLAEYQQLVEDARSQRTISIVLIGSGAALVTAGVLRYLLRDTGSEHSVAITPAEHGGGLITWGGQF